MDVKKLKEIFNDNGSDDVELPILFRSPKVVHLFR